MSAHHERRALALEAIAHALLELAAVEREPGEVTAPGEILIDHRNCEKELGLARRAFTLAAARGDFAAFRVSKRLTATKDDVLTWLKSRKVEPKLVIAPPPSTLDPDAFLKAVHKCFVARVRRPMTDRELDDADTWIAAGRHLSERAGREYADTADDVARRVHEEDGREPAYYRDWRALGIDPAKMEKDAEDLRRRLHHEHPEMGWRERMAAVHQMWDAVTAPLSEAKRAKRAAVTLANKAERARKGQLGLKR